VKLRAKSARLFRWISIGIFAFLAFSPSAARASQPAPIDPTVGRQLHEQLQTIRSQIELWRLQHQDRLPDFQRFPNWEQLVQKTNASGGFEDPQFGPYLNESPRNGLNGLSNVVEVKDKTTTADLPPAGFVFSAPSGHIFATDASGRAVLSDEVFKPLENYQPPRLDGEPPKSREARLRLLASRLQLVQLQMMLYQLQHQDHFPDLAQFPRWEQMTQRTDEKGKPGPNAPFGPYIGSAPANPLTGFDRVALTTDGRQTQQQLVESKIGFILNPATGQLWGVDESGKCLSLPKGMLANP
jgi:hypothetical protein